MTELIGIILTKMNRNKSLKIRLTEQELESIKSKAESASMSVSEYVRNASIKANVKQNSLDELLERKALNTNMNRINSNLNMIAKWCNKFKSGVPAMQVLLELRAIAAKVKEIK